MGDATLEELFGRIGGLVVGAVEHLDPDQLASAPAPGANPIGWLVWHLTRVQDHHVAELAGQQQVWLSGNWAPRFGVAADPSNTGYGHSAEEVAAVRPVDANVLVEYYDAVAQVTSTLIGSATDTDLERVVDRSWDPPVTMRARLVSVAVDDLQHVGQASYVRGLVTG